RSRPRRHQEGLGRVRARAAEDVDAGDVRAPRPLLLDARASGAAEAAAEASSAAVGDRDQPGHGDRRRRPRARLPGRRHSELCGAGASHARIPSAHPALRAGRRRRERPRRDPELPLLPRGCGRRCPGRPALPRHVRAAQRAPVVHARGVPDVRLSVARQPRAGAVAQRRARGSARRAGRGLPRRPGRHHPRGPALGIERRGPRQRAAESVGGAEPGPGAREPAAVRQGGDAGVRERMLVGTGDPGALARGAATLEGFGTEPEKLLGVETLQVAFEVERAGADELLPPGLHPTRPPVVTWFVQRVPESPWGPFALAQCRIECRSGLRPRGFLRGGVIDNEAARAALAARWGYALAPGEPRLARSYDEIRAGVRLGGAAVLELALRDPMPL